ncbi:MAG: bifunctional diaminohydroxyphosphoribosylaminopyrimidine deaminase/5-amino-6-(5-phosphoribosylamino)uracil reductase RibD [Armatimonadetes bacterium]|nr:bifunctional diaminohydroxyphosphoribosylaminopyrimidine deaminase/5-amino-6-(5-phosphoribosylamino)uracil reductase RibD [Armatimonadota bacterium]
MTRYTPDDERHLRRALRLARRGQGRVEPNPMVGCVIVKHGRVIGEGYHRRFGGPHAEVEALRQCTTSPRGATVYVTLEPCCHYGKTPPCTDALLAAGIARVVAPVEDPNPPVAGRGLALLRKAGVRIDRGLLAGEAATLNAPFFKLVREHRPWVILKWAQSLDGKIATRTGDSKWITDEVCRAHAHRTRGRLDAILVGIGTVLTDDPLLTCRVGRPRRVATRVVLDSRLRTPLSSQLVRTARRVPTWVFHGRGAPARRARALEKAGCVLHAIPRSGDGLALPALLDVLGEHQITNVLVEGGGVLLGNFFDKELADEFHIYIAPLLIGGSQAPGPLHALGVSTVARALRLPGEPRVRRLGGGYFVRALPNANSGLPS